MSEKFQNAYTPVNQNTDNTRKVKYSSRISSSSENRTTKTRESKPEMTKGLNAAHYRTYMKMTLHGIFLGHLCNASSLFCYIGKMLVETNLVGIRTRNGRNSK